MTADHDTQQAGAFDGATEETPGEAFDAASPEDTAATDEIPSEPKPGYGWSDTAPRGGRTVLNRVLKEGVKVPLFLGQTAIQTMRDVGYTNTTSALCEHVDNAIQAGATEIRVFFRQSGKKGSYSIDAAVHDNGPGMTPAVLKVASSFGGSMTYGSQKGIGRFGMGMKTAALSMSPVLDVYTWQEKGAFYGMTLDVEAIGRDRSNLIELPEPRFATDLPVDVAALFTKPMLFPSPEQQDVPVGAEQPVNEYLGASGTIVYMPDCDRLTFAKAQTLADDAMKTMARVYRRFINKGVRIYVNNRVLDAWDPTYAMASARHARIPDLAPKHGRLVLGRAVKVRQTGDRTETRTHDVTVRIYMLPIKEWSALPRKVRNNDLRLYDGNTVSILRNDRELYAGGMHQLTKRGGVTNWFRIEIDFGGEADALFGVASNKQGVRIKDWVYDDINAVIGPYVNQVRDEIRRHQAEETGDAKTGNRPSEARANETDWKEPEALDANLTDAEREQLDANLRGLATMLKREGETDEEALKRVREGSYFFVYKHDEYWPFYHAEHKFGKVVVTVNTAHPFYLDLYKPLRDASAIVPAEDRDEDGPSASERAQRSLMALELMLLTLARTQAVMAGTDDEAPRVFETMRRRWSDSLRAKLENA